MDKRNAALILFKDKKRMQICNTGTAEVKD